MTTRVPGRHRVARSRTPLTDLSDGISRTAGGAARTASGAVRTGAVAVAAGGLVVSVALPASAAVSSAPAAAPASVSTSLAAAVPAAYGTTAAGVVSAPETATTTVATTATFSATPEAAPIVVAPAVQRSVRVAEVEPAVATSSKVVKSVAASSSSAAGILDVAADYVGVPYVYGGTTPAGFDCSGYTSYVFRQLGITIPRTANAQLQASTRVSSGSAVPGDLVFFTNSAGSAYHVGIYAGDGMMWDAPRTGKPVQLRAIWSDSVSYGRFA